MKKYKILILLFIHSTHLFSQENYFLNQEKKLRVFVKQILFEESDSAKILAHQKFKNMLIETLEKNKSYSYSFSQMEHVSILQTKNKKFKLFTWFIPYSNGEYEYCGIIQKCKKNGKKCSMYILEDSNTLNEHNNNKKLNYKNWYGCLYYDIIPIKVGKEKYYTLLGWDGNNKNTTKKIIDVVKISKKEDPVFGESIFNSNKKRIVIEYSSKYSLSLKYDKQLDYIVYDHVEPIDGISMNSFNLYAPSLSYDILKKTKSGWKLETNIYLNNTK